LLGCLDEEVDPADEHSSFEQAEKCSFNTPTVVSEQQRRYRGVKDEPGEEKIERLERIETDSKVGSESMRREKNDRRNNPENGHVAEDRSSPVADAVQRICELCGGARLRRPALMAK